MCIRDRPQFALDERSLFKAGDAKDLAERIDWWYEHASIRRQMEKTYAQSAEKYRLKNSIRLAEQMFEEAIAEGKQKEGKRQSAEKE